LDDRASGKKITFGKVPRKIIASAIVSGVATSPEPQVRSRYAHVQVSESLRKVNHFHWFQNTRKDFFIIGRALLRKRQEYVEILMRMLEEWMEDPKLQRIDVRPRLVDGVAYAAITAAVHVFEACQIQAMMRTFRQLMIEHSSQAASDFKNEVNVEIFIQELISCYQ
jgi:hypothetical protein